VTTFLGIDVGSTTTKASLVDVGDGVRELHIERTPTPGDAPGLRVAVARVVRECVRHASGPVAAVGIASMAETGVPLDADGAALSPFIRWNRDADRRPLDEVMRRHPDLPGRTGIPATTKPTLITLTGLRTQQHELFERMAAWASPADLIAEALTGTRATDHTLAARTMLLGPAGHWDLDLLGELGLRPDALPRVLTPGEPVGTTAAGAAMFRLGTGIPVFVAGHDHIVGAWAAGVRTPGAVADSLGTAEAVVRIADTADAPAATADGFSVGRGVDGTRATILGGSPTCGALLADWPCEPPARHPLDILSTADPHDWVTSAATVLPYPRGRQCPKPDPGARLVVPDGLGDEALSRALLQGLVFHSLWMREAIAGHAGAAEREVVLIGSLAHRLPAWAPLVAALGGVPVRRCAAREPVASGAALLAAVRAGAVPAEVVLPSESVEPADAPGLGAAHRRFLDAVEANTPTEGAP
jgi:xylulokinase